MTERERYERAAAIFLELGRAPAEQRPALLEERCGGDSALRAQVESLLSAGDEESVFQTLARDLAGVQQRMRSELAHAATRTFRGGAGREQPADYRDEQPGDELGRYRLIEPIGEGGFGRVWAAEQSEPVQRRVALKVIKSGMDTREVVSRFEQERQALAVMDHPNIAKVFDAGMTQTGRPFFVMELCQGEAISSYCDRQRLTIDERLALFAQVCVATQHAHTKGVIHRDIKPSNVLVSTQDGRPHARIIDFGIAKAIDTRAAAQHHFTQHHQLVGTPAYMSPEQAAGSADIDTRSDVYSLGVLLYELLTGSTPFSTRELLSGAYAEMQRVIREVEPPSPSTRLSQARETLANIASSRRIEPKRLGFVVRGELDWIVMKALEKERGRRYDSASALAEDVRRYLGGEAIVAAPPSRAYRIQKFVGRHRGLVFAGGAVLGALLLGLIGTAWQANLARGERDRAIAAEAETRRRADELQKVSGFQSQMLSQVDPAAAGLRLAADVRTRFAEALSKTALSEEERSAQLDAFAAAWGRVNATDAALALIRTTIFEPALAAIDRQFTDQPMLDARLRSAISERYLDLGLFAEAQAVSAQVVATRRRLLGAAHAETIAAELHDCRLLSVTNRNAEAEALLRPLLDRLRADGVDESLRLTAINQLGEALWRQARYAEGEPLFREAVAGWRRLRGDDDPSTLTSISNLALALRGQGKLAEAESLAREAVERNKRIRGGDHPDTLGAVNNLGTIYIDQGRHQEAEDQFRLAVEGRRRALGEVHRATLLSTNNLAATLERAGKLADAEALQREMLERTRRVLGADHPDALLALSSLATTLTRTGNLAEAETLCRESLARRERVYGAVHESTLIACGVMANLHGRQGRPADAEPYFRRMLDIGARVWGDDHPERIRTLISMGRVAAELERLDESEGYLRDALERSRRTLGPVHPRTIESVHSLGATLISAGKMRAAVETLSAAEADFRKAATPADTTYLRTLLRRLGTARVSLGAYAAGESNLREAYDLCVAAGGPGDAGAQACVKALLECYDAWHAAEPQRGYDAEAEAWRAKATTTQAAIEPTSRPNR